MRGGWKGCIDEVGCGDEAVDDLCVGEVREWVWGEERVPVWRRGGGMGAHLIMPHVAVAGPFDG